MRPHAAADPVSVCVRVKPMGAGPSPSLTRPEPGTNRIAVRSQREDGRAGEAREYEFGGGVLVDTSQEDVFRHCAARLCDDAVQRGVNGTILAYGQTGAGKTYTMSGGNEGYGSRGVAPRAIQHVFHEIAQAAANVAVTVRVSYLEIYNETLYDLLKLGVDEGEPNAPALAIRERRDGSTYVRGLACPVARTEQDALKLLFEGDVNRAVAEHQLNAASTRSHCIFTLHIERRFLAADSEDEESEDGDSNDDGTRSRGPPSPSRARERVVRAKLHLADLAGSERLRKTGSTGAMAREARHINKSLSFLEQAVLALGDRERDHVPFRQSRLTHYLKDSLGGNSRTVLVACIWPEDPHAVETRSTLDFASRMARIRNTPVVNEERAAAKEARRLQRRVSELEAELALYDAVTGRVAVSRGRYPPPELSQLWRAVRHYVTAEVPGVDVVQGAAGEKEARLRNVDAAAVVSAATEPASEDNPFLDTAGRLRLLSVRQVCTAFAMLRHLARGPEVAAQHPAPAGEGAEAPAADAAENGVEAAAPQNPVRGVERGGGDETSGAVEARLGAENVDEGAAAEPSSPSSSRAPPTPAPEGMTPEQAFAAFTAADGAAEAEAVSKARAALRDAKAAAKEVAGEVNAAAAEVEETRRAAREAAPGGAAHHRLSVGGDEEAEGAGIGPSEASVRDRQAAEEAVKAAKQRYRAAYDRLGESRRRVDYCKQALLQRRAALVSHYRAWASARGVDTDGQQAAGGEHRPGPAEMRLRSPSPLRSRGTDSLRGVEVGGAEEAYRVARARVTASSARGDRRAAVARAVDSRRRDRGPRMAFGRPLQSGNKEQ